MCERNPLAHTGKRYARLLHPRWRHVLRRPSRPGRAERDRCTGARGGASIRSLGLLETEVHDRLDRAPYERCASGPERLYRESGGTPVEAYCIRDPRECKGAPEAAHEYRIDVLTTEGMAM